MSVIISQIKNPYHSSYIDLIHKEYAVKNTEFNKNKKTVGYKTITTNSIFLHLSHASCSYIADHVCSLLDYNYTTVNCWGVHYVPNFEFDRHDHAGFDYTFVYYVSVPENSPIIFDYFSYTPRDRDLIIFPASLHHWVEPVPHDRYIIAGNLKEKKN